MNLLTHETRFNRTPNVNGHRSTFTALLRQLSFRFYITRQRNNNFVNDRVVPNDRRELDLNVFVSNRICLTDHKRHYNLNTCIFIIIIFVDF